MNISSPSPDAAPEPRSSWWRVGLVAGLFVCILYPRINSGTLWQHDELLTANRGQEMLLRGDPFSVTYNFAPDFRKPPVHYWLVATALRALPMRPELAVRLPSLLGGAACLLALAALARQAYPGDGPRIGFYAVLALAGCGYFVHHSRAGYLDTGAALWLILTVLGCMRAREDPRWWWFAGACAAVGAWQKAPFAFGAWMVILVVRWASNRRHPGQSVAFSPHLAAALAVSVVAASGWTLWQGTRFGFPAVFAAVRWQTHALTEAHSLENTRLRPYLYWVWMARDWALVGLCAPVAVACALWPEKTTRPSDVRRSATKETGWVCAVFLLGLVATPFRVERYLVVITPLLALLTVRWLDDYPWRFPHALPTAARRWLLPTALVSTVPVAIFHYVNPAPARTDLRAAARDLGGRVGHGETVLLSAEGDPDRQVGSFVGFYAKLRGPWRELRPEEIRAWPTPSHGLCQQRQWETLRHECPALRPCAVYRDWVVWERAD